MSIPDRPDPAELIASAWGDWVHDAIVELGGGAGSSAAVVVQPTANQLIDQAYPVGEVVPLQVLTNPHGSAALVGTNVVAWKAGRYRYNFSFLLTQATPATVTEVGLKFDAYFPVVNTGTTLSGERTVTGTYVGTVPKAVGETVMPLTNGFGIYRTGSNLTVASQFSYISIDCIGA